MYRMELPDPVGTRGPRLVPALGEPTPDSSDPLVTVQPFDTDIRLLAEALGVPWVNMCYRVVEIMRDLAPREEWSAAAEKQLMAQLESCGLRLSFRRPRATLVRRALFHAVAELIDAGSATPDLPGYIQFTLRSYDPAMLLHEPRSRPMEVVPMIGLGEWGEPQDDWLECANEAVSLVARGLGDDWAVIAEHTRLRGLRHSPPEEIRSSVIRSQQATKPHLADGSESFFDVVVKALAQEYGTYGTDGRTAPVALRHNDYGYITPGADWLALNPWLAREVGWQVSEEGLFRWVDEAGRIMVETVWWLDGLPDQSGYSGDEVGEGWLIVASQDAWQQLLAALGPADRLAAVQRRTFRDGQPVTANVRSVLQL